MNLVPLARRPAVRRPALTPVVLARAVEEIEAPSRSFAPAAFGLYDAEGFRLARRETGRIVDIRV